jgi:lipid II:glycine glycyltransferase (peptidoglycan interpeptide bridge formation enzyme)
MNTLFNDDIPVNFWKEFITVNSHATPFQTPEFLKIISSVKNLSGDAIAVSDSNTIKALAVVSIIKEAGIKGFFSRRAIIYGGPIIDNSNIDALDLLLRKISEKLGKKVIYIETRNFSDYTALREVFSLHGYIYVPYLNFRVFTTDMEIMCGSISRSRMRQIRKAQKNSVEWKEAENIEEVKVFYGILSHIYRYKIGKPLLPFEFFRNFFDSGLGKYLLVCYRDEIIGGIMCPIMKGKAIYEFYICGLDDKYKEQYPSVMATWAAMEYANKNKIPYLDFMGAGRPDEKYGVRDFKARFGGKLVEYGRFIKVNNHFLYNLGKLGLKVKKNISI